MEPELHFFEGHVRSLPDDVEETRTIPFVISSKSRDRKRTAMNMDNWRLDNYNRNGVVGYQHNLYGDLCAPPNPDDVIGQGRAWREGDELIGSVKFETFDLNPLADKIFRKVLAGTLRATSVGMLPLRDENGELGRYGEGEEAKGRSQETFYFHGQELIEFSIVNIPANPDAVRRTMRDHSARALLYVRRQTGLDLAEIERLTVKDLLRALDGKEARAVEAVTGEEATESRTPAVEVLGDPLLSYKLRQKRAELGL